MEIHRDKVIVSEVPQFAEGPFRYFEKAKRFGYDNYKDEIERILSTKFESVTPEKFFHEYIWTIHTTGFSAKAVGKFFGRLIEAYGSFESLAKKTEVEAHTNVAPVCNNPQKISAVWKTSKMMVEGIKKTGWDNFRQERLSTPELIGELPFIGKVTRHHIARNIGLLDSVKPDLHLIRMAKYWNFEDCISMCKSLQEEGMPLGIVDLLLWYSASHFTTTNIKQPGER